jgi:endonuclease/exonuclease/phosphatase (EEP) superfamily protein YafD
MSSNFNGNQVTSFVIQQPTPVQIVCVYRSPQLENNMSCLIKLLKQHIKSMMPLIVFGDFNANYQTQDHKYRQLEHYFTQFACMQIIEDFTTDSNTTIDHIWTNIRPDLLMANSLESYYSDHKPIQMSLLALPIILS